MQDALDIAAQDAVYDFMTALNDHIANRVHYDTNGPRYAGENPPDQTEIQKAFMAAIKAVVRNSFA